jgi:hypothetical protein
VSSSITGKDGPSPSQQRYGQRYRDQAFRPAAGSEESMPPSGEWSGRAFGGPSAGAAFGGDLNPALVATQGDAVVRRSVCETDSLISDDR